MCNQDSNKNWKQGPGALVGYILCKGPSFLETPAVLLIKIIKCLNCIQLFRSTIHGHCGCFLYNILTHNINKKFVRVIGYCGQAMLPLLAHLELYKSQSNLYLSFFCAILACEVVIGINENLLIYYLNDLVQTGNDIKHLVQCLIQTLMTRRSFTKFCLKTTNIDIFVHVIYYNNLSYNVDKWEK